ncbi:molecular chaperone Hsp31 and glyoxalase 3 [Polaribacter sp. Hel1_33_78]|jgi:molecular chaperone Hsp31 and glyoxalase 3|uniref:glyoxalase III HchA n=1 Tax=Polaribacter sp. Hel1_33_78 TaxID=1336804 RepID=UPI000879E2C8|nr:glyoxalase III HchA [Polaribacter sp. Hel1_33_78]SDU05266.1 molecular chaperone Hsp31 and glyoxalase 3 [Polaribacter sp. Hel1_33_78]
MKKTLIGLASILILIVITLYITTRPAKTANGTYSPSPLALKLATSSITNFDNTTYENKYTGNKKVLMICTEERNMTMANGKKFSTGNHPVEMLLPVLHLKNAGFDVDVVTPTGKPVAVEMWAMPEDDENVKNIYAEFRNKLEKPGSLADFVTNSLIDSTNYVAIFFPGGHGAMLGLPENKDVSNLVNWSYKKGLFTLAICHGPAALLAASLEVNGDDFIYKGYKIASFPDAVDAQGPMIGYTPGKMPWIYGEKLNKLGVTIINKEADNTVNIDRKLITGASPQAANDFGKLVANELLKEVNR